MHKQIRLVAAVVAISSVGIGCSSGAGARGAQLVPTTPAVLQMTTLAQPVAPVDPVLELLASADRYFETGRSELALGHLAAAKTAFNQSLEVLLELPQGVHGEPRIREHFERLVDRIAALELSALATGDGFTEQRAEPASIDELLTFDTTPPTATTTENVLADLQETTHDIPIPLNDRVLRYVELFQGRLREYLSAGLSRGAQYLPMIQNVFRAEGLPLDLAYVPLIESAFKPTALSRAKAKGVWQFMPATGGEMGLKQDWFIDERSDPEKATIAAARYFKSLHRMFDDWHLAMASYNGGPGRMQRAIKKAGERDFWDLTATSRFLPRETRDYVPMILAAVIIAKNPAKYGFDVIATPAPEVETVAVPRAVDLRRVAEWAGVSADHIQRLNPELRRWTTPMRAGSYDLTVPSGTAELVREKLAEASPNELNALQWHVVKRGETLTTIARKLRVNRKDLAEANYLRTNSKVNAGRKLLIPRMPSAALLARAGRGDGPGTTVDSAAEATFEDSATEEITRLVHRVKAGETLSSIARKYQTTVEHLRSVNNLRGSTLKVGLRLTVKTTRAVATQQQQQ
jgi:membrane-bound lytic murein transglycosylase D